VAEKYRDILVSGIGELNLKLDQSKIDQLLAYHQLLIKWNKAYNLTAVRDPTQMISRHLLDSLSLVTLIDGQRFIDVGTGAGLPGIILAIVFPNRQFDLLDSNGKKTRFLIQAKMELRLDNIIVLQCRVEQHSSKTRYDGVLSRAFSPLVDMVKGSQHLLKEGGKFYAMKGIYPQEELSELEKNYKVKACHSLQVPGEQGERHLVVISQQD
jgi:16S rRNA (guanine527-N7)-methyltransferase